MNYDFRLAGLGFRIESPIPLDLHPHYLPFLAEHIDPDVTIRVLCDAPVYPEEAPVYQGGRLAVYRTERGWFREHRIWETGEKHPGNPCLAPTGPGCWALHVPASRLASLAEQAEFFWMLAPEARFAERDRLLLHASSVILNGKAYAFSGPPGIGKSTHAALWESALGATQLNGDRTVLERTDAGFVAHGSPFCGSSNLCVQKSAPLGGLCILQQGPENRVEQLNPAEAFRQLLAQMTVNQWDRAQVATICDLLIHLVRRPVCRLTCRPDAEAARVCLEAFS